MAEFDFNSLSQQEQQELRKQYYLNQAQNSLLSPGPNPDMSQYQFKKPENIGQAFGNMFKNQIANPIQERLGMRESLRSVTRKMQIAEMQREQARSFLDAANREQLQNFFVNQGMPSNIVNNLGIDELRDIAVSRMSNVETDPYGVTSQTNVLTGEQQVINAPPENIQQFEYELNRRQNRNSQTPSPLRQPYPNLGNFTPGTYANEMAQLEADREVKQSRSQKFDDRAIARIDGITTPIYKSMAGIGNKRASLSQLSQILDMGLQTGKVEEFLTGLRAIGFNLGLDVKDPSMPQVFSSITKQIVGPMVKDLGTNPTDTDLKLILDSYPSLGQTVEGNRILIEAINLKLERDEILANSLMSFEDNNRDLLRSDPIAYRQQLDRMVLRTQNSEEFRKKSVLQLKARASALMGKEPDIDQLMKTLEVN